MAQVNFRIDDETKRQAEELFGQMGLTMTSAIMVFIKQSINQQGIPFKVCANNLAYHEKLLQAKRDWENGRKNFHEHDLIEVDDKKKKQKAKPRRTVHRSRKSAK